MPDRMLARNWCTPIDCSKVRFFLPVFLVTGLLAFGQDSGSGPQSIFTTCPPSTRQAACILQQVQPASVPAVKWNGLALLPPTTAAGPFQQQFDLRIRDGANAIFALVTVPDGMHLVIETVSLYGSVPTGQVPDISFTTTAAGSSATYHLGISRQDTRDKVDWIIGNQAMRLYADPPSVIVLVMRSTTTGDAAFSISVSGYLVASQ